MNLDHQNLPVGDELDALIAEKLMGYRDRHDVYIEGCVPPVKTIVFKDWPGPKDNCDFTNAVRVGDPLGKRLKKPYWRPPGFTYDVGASNKLIKEVQRRWHASQLDWRWRFTDLKGGWLVEMMAGGGVVLSHQAETLPLAIAQAALLLWWHTENEPKILLEPMICCECQQEIHGDHAFIGVQTAHAKCAHQARVRTFFAEGGSLV